MIIESGVYIERVSLLFPYLIHGIKLLVNSTVIAGIINGKVNWKVLLYITHYEKPDWSRTLNQFTIASVTAAIYNT